MATGTALKIEDNIWSPSDQLSPRVKRLRQEYFSFRQRDYFRNEVLAFGTGDPHDILFSPHHWGVAPEVFLFSNAMQDTLLATATPVELPEGFWQEPLAVRRAIFFQQVLKKYLPVKILAGELIVGSYFNTALSKSLTPREREEWQRAEKKWRWSNLRLNFFGIGNCGAVPGHLIPNYAKVIERGFSGLVAEFKALQAGASAEHAEFLRALIIAGEAAGLFAERYAAEAERLLAAESDPERKKELQAIAGRCRKVPWQPAESFAEAVQSLWLTHMLVMAAESYPGPGLSPGRVDQYLYPYFRRDLESGRLDREQARELLQCYFIKHNYAYDFMGRVGPNQGINSGFGQLITLGGIGPEEKDASNELTWLFLDVIEDMNLLEPKPNLRLHRGTPDELLDRIVELLAKAQGAPFLLNFDETSMAGLKWAGLPEDKLWDYAPVGCLENTLQGNDRSGTVDVNLNLAKAVELVMGNGRDLRWKWRLGARTGNPERFSSFEEFYRAFEIQLDALMDRILKSAGQADAIRARFEPTPYLSALVDGCAEKGKDVSAGGPWHNFITVEGVALATAVDSLAAVKKLVFDTESVSMRELLLALRSNFKDQEVLRQKLSHKAPKYGNDDPEADAIARRLNAHFSREVFRRVSPATGRRFRAGYLSWNYWIFYANSLSATPDGRPRGTYLSNGVCPVTGTDRQGPTAVALSVANLDLSTVPNGASHTISFNPALLRTPAGRSKLKAFLQGYAEKGGSALQVNLVSPELLRQAQKEPESFHNLLVRVTGYNAYFTTLGQEIQEEIISREAHALVRGEG